MSAVNVCLMAAEGERRIGATPTPGPRHRIGLPGR
jgi:hypothetical protein